MKKTYLTFVIVLVAVFLILFFLGQRSEYAAEKALWKINQQMMEVGKDPNIVPDVTFLKIHRQYKEFTRKHAKSKLAPVANILSARIFILKKDFDKAREILEEVVEIYKDEPDIAVQAVSEIALTYQQQQSFLKMVDVFKRMKNEYPTTELGFLAPLRIGQFYASQNELTQAQRYFNEAIEHYNNLIAQNADDQQVVFNAMRSKAVCYMGQEQWQNAVDIFGEVLLKFAESELLTGAKAERIIKSINTISMVNIKSYEMPIKIYTQFIEKYPQHQFVPSLAKMKDSFVLLEKEKAIIEIK
ncbi:MAG: hypothetical protein KC713_06780 [Candidatus Omnitrophica bacterium]|nr:hypothetical protein [Candidatus Omnitrophota bacterium]